MGYIIDIQRTSSPPKMWHTPTRATPILCEGRTTTNYCCTGMSIGELHDLRRINGLKNPKRGFETRVQWSVVEQAEDNAAGWS